MRILLLSPGYPLDGELYGHAVAEQVAAIGAHHHVVVQSLSARARLPATDAPRPGGTSRGIEVHGPPRGGRARRLAGIWRRHRAWAPDLVWGLWIDRSGPASLALARGWGAGVVASVMGGELADMPRHEYGGRRRRRGRAVVQAVLRAADRVTVGSRWLAEQARALGRTRGLAEAPIGIAPAGRLARPRGGEAVSLATVTDVSAVKGAGEVFAALRALRATGVPAQLTVYTLSPEPGRAELRRMTEARGVAAHVRFAPPAPGPRLREALADHHALVSASFHESQGLAFIEAAMAGLPVVAPAVGVIEDLAQMGAAVVSAGRDEMQLAAAVGEGLASPPGPEVAAAVAARFGLPACTQRFLAVFEAARR